NSFTGLPLVEFPLGYPAMLWLLHVVSGLSVETLAPVMNMFLFAGLLFLSNRLLLSMNLPFLLRALILACLSCSPALLEVYSMLWSETLFLFLSVLFFVLLNGYFKRPVLLRLAVAALTCSLAMVTRYAGVTLLAVGVFFLFFDPDTTLRRKASRLFLWVVLSSSLLLLNLLRNQYYLHQLTGVRERSLHGLSEIIREMGDSLSDWLPFLHGHPNTATVVWIVLLVTAAILLIKRILQPQYLPSPDSLLLATGLFYAGFMLLAAWVSRFEYLTSRLLSPLYIPLFIAVPAICYQWARQKTKPIRNMMWLVLLCWFLGLQLQYYRLNAEAWEGIKDAGIPGYSEDSWTRLPLVQYLQAHPLTGTVYANAPDAAWYLCGIRSKPLPHKDLPAELGQLLQVPKFALVWFTDGDNPDLVSFDYLCAHARLLSMKRIEGGWIAQFQKK
ncbi:MAG TPA: hypothetical protein VG842_11645, partial [Sediminibacterium sp.]|nr:hypothetical protein [Sediminibacterium sp.]